MQEKLIVISLTPVTDEPRVIRQVKALINKGYQVAVCGYKGKQAVPPDWIFIDLERKTPLSFGRKVSLLFFLFLSRFSIYFAHMFYWSHLNYSNIYSTLIENKDIHDSSLIICHDFFTLPIADRLSQKIQAPYSVDLHEYALEQYQERFFWRFFIKPWIHQIQKKYLPRSCITTTVCQGIADRLAMEYDIPLPIVIRSCAQYQKMPLREVGKPIKVLYHGLISPSRGLEEAIDSVTFWENDTILILRGPGEASYIKKLQRRIDRNNVGHRVFITPPILFKDLIKEANQADIGYFLQGNYSLQKLYALPNKFFEYIMAGLALCVSHSTEMTRIVKENEVGVIVDSLHPVLIADAINNLNRVQIMQYKKNSLALAQELCWENESKKMINTYETALSRI